MSLVAKTIKEYNLITKKIDAVRRCTDIGFDCNKISIEKPKTFCFKRCIKYRRTWKKGIEKFWDLKFIKSPMTDIFNLNFEKISRLEGWGFQSAENLKNSINKSKKLKLDKFIYSLGIRHIGQENAKLISEFLGNYLNFIKLKIKKILRIYQISMALEKHKLIL